MAFVTLSHIWINLVSTGAEVHAKSSDRTQARNIDGQVITFAGGRQRSISSAGLKGQFPFTLRDVSPASILTLENWIGDTVQLRDHRGKKLFGVYYGVNIGERKDRDLYDVSIVFNELTFEEGSL